MGKRQEYTFEAVNARLREGKVKAGVVLTWRNVMAPSYATSINLIRATLGDALSYKQRVDRAIAKILTSRAWTPLQRKWLERITKRLLRPRQEATFLSC